MNWTKEQIKKVIELWDTKSSRQIAEEIGTDYEKISHIVAAMRKLGIPLKTKYRRNPTTLLIKEIKDEMGIK